MEQNNETILWKRAWRQASGEVHSTRPYASKEELMKDLEKDGHLEELPHGHAWCGEPFSFVADEFALADFERCKENDRKRKGCAGRPG